DHQIIRKPRHHLLSLRSQYFPLHALALYEQRRRERLGLATAAPCTTGAPPLPEAALACSQF
ncbi:MAG: hypothetical protein OXK82_04625, partial [Deltaproteobacteria bacterium]|nr:hypothetical protein [Deltaproteobacteria bacterium]